MAELIRTEEYPIYIGNDSLEALSAYFKLNTFSSCFILLDEHTAKYCLPILLDQVPFLAAAKVIVINSGEINKTLATCTHIWEELTAGGAGRKSILVNLGGGVITDMGGFAAKTYKRGIHFVNVPTTLLSQVDASIGGKLGVDFNGFKNHIGLFGYPNIICINAAFLKSLPSREIKSGFAEVIKHALIQDKIYWEAIQYITDVSEMEWNSCITRSVGVKKKVVDQDPFENGIRKALNFGHTLGHAFETYLLNTEQHLLHGEAVALGMIIEAYLSNKKGLLSDSDLQSIVSFIIQIYGKANIEGYDWNQLLACMGQDKKNVSNKISFTLLNGIGDVVIDQHFETAAILEAVEYYQSL